jgi:hypothetical protein|tara:strand:- start:1108 stop:1302 length:195 start_codon:yes stop_codon:yes gene_type:complete
MDLDEISTIRGKMSRTFKIKGQCIYVDLIRSIDKKRAIVMDLETDKIFTINLNKLERLNYELGN